MSWQDVNILHAPTNPGDDRAAGIQSNPAQGGKASSTRTLLLMGQKASPGGCQNTWCLSSKAGMGVILRRRNIKEADSGDVQ